MVKKVYFQPWQKEEWGEDIFVLGNEMEGIEHKVLLALKEKLRFKEMKRHGED